VRVTLEIAVGTPDEAVTAVRAGADRLELAAGLEVGGLTASRGVFRRVKELVAVPVWVLLRPRAGGFVYSADEMESILRDAEMFIAAGADGLVVGALDANSAIAAEPCRRLASVARGRITFHRAFDFTAEPYEALEQLIALGFQRILTSGGAPTARVGTAKLTELIARAAGRIEIMPGGGIRPENVVELVRATGCQQVHASARTTRPDACLARTAKLAAAMGADDAGWTSATDAVLVASLRKELNARLH
jgi:copper homeostasis protein CutC